MHLDRAALIVDEEAVREHALLEARWRRYENERRQRRENANR